MTAFADGFAPRDHYTVRSLEIRQPHHIVRQHAVLARLRQDVHQAVRLNRPHLAVAPLKRILQLDPHDYHAWAFLSYTYAVLGDVPSAANVDLDFVALFEPLPQFYFVPAVRHKVVMAMRRLQAFDPLGWQQRVDQTRLRTVPFIPIETMDRFVQRVRPSCAAHARQLAYTEIERVLTTREERVRFIQQCGSGSITERIDRVEVFKKASHVVRVIE